MNLEDTIKNRILGEKNLFGDIFFDGEIAFKNKKKFNSAFCRKLAIAIRENRKISCPDSGLAFQRLVIDKFA